MTKLRLGLIGYGKVANLYMEAIKGTSCGEIVSVCGRSRDRRNQFAAKWGIASRDTAEEMARLDHVDAAIIATPHPNHRDGAVEAFAAGLHCLVEKPMAKTVAECDEMIAAASKAGKQLSVTTQRRWFPACARIKDAINAGKLGKPCLLELIILGWRDEAYYNADPWRGKWDMEGGGVLINQAAHQIDLMCWYMGEIDEIKGYWDNFNHPYIKVEDSAVAVVKFKSGALASVFASNSQKPGIYAKVHVHGTSGATAGVQTDGGAMFVAGMSTITEPPLNDLWTIPGEEPLLEKFRADDAAFFQSIDGTGGKATTYFFTMLLEDYCKAILAGKATPTTGKDGRETVKFIETMYKTGGAPGYS